MNPLILFSILLRLVAMGWSLVLLRRLREWRMGLLAAMLGLMALRQYLTMKGHVLLGRGESVPVHGAADELPALLVSLLALVFVVVLDRLLSRSRKETEDRRRAEESLQRKAARQRVMLEQLPAVVWTADRNLRFTSSLGAALGGLGLEPNQVVGMTLQEYFDNDARDFPPLVAARRALAGESVSFELEWENLSFQTLVEPLRDAGDHIVGVVGVALDVTALTTSELALRESEERYRSFVATSTEGIWRMEIDGGVSAVLAPDEQVELLYERGYVAECNHAFAQMYGHVSASQMIGRRLEDVLPRSESSNTALLEAFVHAGYKLSEAEVREQDQEGGVHHYVVSMAGVQDRGVLARIWGTQREVTAQRLAEEGLRESEARYRELFEESQIPIFISTPDGRVLDLNPAGFELLGLDSKEDALGVNIEREFYVDPMDRQRAARQLERQGSIKSFPLRLRKRDGSSLLVLETATAVRGENGEIVAYRGMLQDVTLQRALQEQLQQAQRMEAVGRLAEGVAHDFNNLLTVINGQCDLLLVRMEPDSDYRAGVEATKQAGRRAAELTQRLLILSRRRIRAVRPLDLNEVIRGVEGLLRRTLGERIELEIRLDDDLPEVRADAAQMEQVLLNLAINARDAMPNGGRLSVISDETRVEDEPGFYPQSDAAEIWVRLTVEDTGEGIDPEVRDRIFEPFFTTKSTPEATGFGLSTVYGIVEQSGGLIRVTSEPDAGARFEILLPPDLAQSVGEGGPGDEGPNEAAGETLLLVEDDESVRALLKRYLVLIGYRVLDAPSGQSALDLAETAEGGIDCLIADLILPDLQGRELASRLQEGRPGLKALFMSGYGQDPPSDGEEGPVLDEHNFLQKPFATEDLARRLRSLLGG